MKSGLAALLCASAILPLQPSTPTFPFEGTWIAVDRNTRTITGAVVSRPGDAWALEMTGACEPIDCKLPALSLTPIADPANSNRYDRAQPIEEFPGVRRVTTLQLDGETLIVDISTTARNDAGRPVPRDRARLIRRPPAPLVPKTARSGVEAAVQAVRARIRRGDRASVVLQGRSASASMRGRRPSDDDGVLQDIVHDVDTPGHVHVTRRSDVLRTIEP